MSEQRTDHAAEAATSEHPDVGDGQGLAAPGAHPDGAPGEAAEPSLPSSVPGIGRDELGQDEEQPQTEGARQLVETVRSISRLEESNEPLR